MLPMTGEPIESVPLTVRDDDTIIISGTRVTLDTVVGAFRDGATAEEIVFQYPSLALADVYAVLGYYLRHRNKVEAYLARREEQSEGVRRENEDRFSPVGIRKRLLARKPDSH